MRGPHNAILLAGLILSIAVGQPASAQQASDAQAPEAADAIRAARTVSAREWMVAVANPLAAEAAAAALRDGGGAVDAAIAAQLVLGLVEPQSSGLGGGAFVVYFDAGADALTTFDGRETAPRAATPTLFQDASGEPLTFLDAVIGGRSVGTPGTPRLMETLHRRYGRLPWARLFAPAIALAEAGFPISPRLAALVAGDRDNLSRNPGTAAYFLHPDGTPRAMGEILRNPAYADTLRRLAEGGADAFYSGPIAADVVGTVTSAANPGVLAAEDLAAYRVIEREPVCAPYRVYSICGMGPPSSGGLVVGQVMAMLGGYDLAALGPESPDAWRLVADASRLSFADRERYMADADFVPMPTAGLLDAGYLADRAALLAGPRALADVAPGAPKWSHARLQADDEAIELPATSHLSIVDADGNALAMTTTIESGFGSRLMVRGFLLNNELTDFSFRSHRDGVPIANRVEPGKRPRSSMAPTIVLEDGAPHLVLGSPGGSQIPGYVIKTLVARLDFGMGLGEAVAAPNILARFGPVELEADTPAAGLAPALEGLGFATRLVEMTSGVQAIEIGPQGLTGAADPRREGVVIGE